MYNLQITRKDKTQDSKVGDSEVLHNVSVPSRHIQYWQHNKRCPQNWQQQILFWLKHCWRPETWTNLDLKPEQLCQYCHGATLGRGPGARVSLSCVVVIGFKLQYLWKVQYYATDGVPSGECPQAYGIYTVSPGDAAQNFACTFWKTAIQYWRTAELFVTKDEKENGPAGTNRGLGVRTDGLCPGSVFKMAFQLHNSLNIYAHCHVHLSNNNVYLLRSLHNF